MQLAALVKPDLQRHSYARIFSCMPHSFLTKSAFRSMEKGVCEGGWEEFVKKQEKDRIRTTEILLMVLTGMKIPGISGNPTQVRSHFPAIATK